MAAVEGVAGELLNRSNAFRRRSEPCNRWVKRGKMLGLNMQRPDITREQAVERLTRAGFVAFARDWALRESVGASSGSYKTGEIICYPDMLYIYPASGGWRIDDFDAGSDDTEYGSLAEAVAVAEIVLGRKKGRRS